MFDSSQSPIIPASREPSTLLTSMSTTLRPEHVHTHAYEHMHTDTNLKEGISMNHDIRLSPYTAEISLYPDFGVLEFVTM